MDSLFVPRPSLTGGHRMTLYSWGNPRYFPRLPRPSRRYFDVAVRWPDGTQQRFGDLAADRISVLKRR